MAASNPSPLRRHLAPALVAAASALIGLLLLVWLSARLTRLSYDLPFAWRKNLNADEIRMVYLDDASFRQLNPQQTPALNRSYHAQLIDRLTAAGARAIVFDIVFDGPSADPNADRQFADAIRRSRRVVLAGLFQTTPALYADKPADAFLVAAAGWGYINLQPDPRLADEFFPNPPSLPGAPNIPWLPRRVAQLLGGKDLDASADAWFNFAGPPGSLRSVSYYQALLPDGAPPGFFQNSIVFIGDNRAAGASGETRDSFDTPYSDWGYPLIRGVDLHATATWNLLHHNWLSRPAPWLEILAVILTAVVASFGLLRLSPLWAAAAAVATGLLLTGAAFLLHWYAHLWFAWLILLLQIALALAASLVWNSLQSYVQKRLLEDSLSARLSPAVVKRMTRSPDSHALGGDRRDLSIIFTDIADFTRISPMRRPEDLVADLNQYFAVAVQCVHEADGTIVSFIGDAIFAIWNAPLEQPDHRQRACRAAVTLRQQLARFQATDRSLPLRTRVGLHSGSAIVGNIGSAHRFSYTAIGPAINFASRLEGLNKHFGSNVLASREIQFALEKDFAWRFLGHVKPKGVSHPDEIYELVGGPEQIEPSRPWRELFADALQDFRARKFDAAAEKFQAVHPLRHCAEPDLATASGLTPEDGPARFYLEKIEEFRLQPPPDGWLGEIELKEK